MKELLVWLARHRDYEVTIQPLMEGKNIVGYTIRVKYNDPKYIECEKTISLSRLFPLEDMEIDCLIMREVKDLYNKIEERKKFLAADKLFEEKKSEVNKNIDYLWDNFKRSCEIIGMVPYELEYFANEKVMIRYITLDNKINIICCKDDTEEYKKYMGFKK